MGAALQALAPWLVSLAWPLVKKVLIALGIGFATYEGLALIGDQVRNAVLANWGEMSGIPLQFLSMMGVPTAIGIILGAISARIAMQALARITKVI